MGRQDGIIQLTGRIGNLSFYKSQDGYLVRKKSGVSRRRIMSDPAYARTRKNITEFARGAGATKLIRRAFYSLIHTAADNRVTSRLTSAIMKVIKSDAINPSGERNVADGDITLLEGFGFNKNASLEKAFSAPFIATFDRPRGKMKVTVPEFSPGDKISAPEGATHFRLKSIGAAFDFEANTCRISDSETSWVPVNQEKRIALELSHTVTEASVNPLLLVLGIEFVKLVNGREYPLVGKTFNAMGIVKADASVSAEVKTSEDNIRTRTAPAHRRRNHSPVALFADRQPDTSPSQRTRVLDRNSRQSSQLQLPAPRSPTLRSTSGSPGLFNFY